jgi:methyltransferase (TIGR00027 family)
VTEEKTSPSVPEGVGVTAIGVAAVRAAESLREDRLFDDPFAAAFLAAAGWPPASLDNADGDIPPHWLLMLRSVVVRTRFLDDFLRDVTAAGCRQIALLGAGLDARAFRLDWPVETRLFELDTLKMLNFKASVLAGIGAKPKCERIGLRGDITYDLPYALNSVQFDPGQPTAWVAEGLLMYLTTRQNEELLSNISALSAPGSTLALTLLSQDRRTRMEQAGDSTVVDMWQSGAPEDPVEWLAGHGWEAETFDAVELIAEYGRPGYFDDLGVRSGVRSLLRAVRAS